MTCRRHRTTLCMVYYVIWAHGAPRILTLIWRTFFRKERDSDIFICFYQRGSLCLHHKGFSNILFETREPQNNNRTHETFSFFIFQHVMVWCGIKFYNFKRFLACMIFLTTRSVLVFLPGKRSMAWIILVSAFHLSCKFLARL